MLLLQQEKRIVRDDIRVKRIVLHLLRLLLTLNLLLLLTLNLLLLLLLLLRRHT